MVDKSNSNSSPDGDRRTGEDRRVDDQPVEHEDRRKDDRRSGEDRRKTPRS